MNKKILCAILAFAAILCISGCELDDDDAAFANKVIDVVSEGAEKAVSDAQDALEKIKENREAQTTTVTTSKGMMF